MTVVEDEKALLKKLSLESVEFLPKMFLDDPVLNGLDCEPGTIIEFTSINPANNVRETIYRVVVEA